MKSVQHPAKPKLKKRNNAAQKALESIEREYGPTSASLGEWFIKANCDVRSGEARAKLDAILESYKPGLWYRNTRAPIPGQDRVMGERDLPATEFIDLGTDLETRNLCYRVADVKAARDADTAPSFSMLGQKGVLSGVDLLVWREQKSRDAELAGFRPKRKRKAKGTKAEKEKPGLKLRRVPMEVVVQRYSDWCTDPCAETDRLLWEDVFALLQCWCFADKTTDGQRLWEHQRYEELLNEFLMGFSVFVRRQLLTDGKPIGQFLHYLRRSWRFAKIHGSKEVAKYDRFHPDEDEDEEYATTASMDDGRDYTQWLPRRDHPHVLSPSHEEVTASWEERLSALHAKDPVMADLVGYKVAGLTDEEAGKRMGKSRQQVVRMLAKLRAEAAA